MRKFVLALGLIGFVVAAPLVGFSEEQSCRVERYQCGTKKDCRDVYIGQGITTKVCTEVPIYCERNVCN